MGGVRGQELAQHHHRAAGGAALRYLLDKNPGLRAALADSIAESYGQAADLAAQESGLSAAAFPMECPYSQGQILDRDFYPPRTRSDPPPQTSDPRDIGGRSWQHSVLRV
ncbi:DUF29 family protein [uncultured Lamprocystis sp.]|uniref:DUF29 family protein n=1 Tax=uncultured Lamprocystis sp. TaxID=543132 RepID=UPI0025DB092C|nr:DUF29 family protein [uncultured Lamprocystis sp.]